MSKGLGGVVNQAHLIHDQSAGRSSTRLHAPPGGHSSMGTGFGWVGPRSPPTRPRLPTLAHVSQRRARPAAPIICLRARRHGVRAEPARAYAQGDDAPPPPARGGRAGMQQHTQQAGAVYSAQSYREQAPQSEYSPPMSSAQWAAESGLQAEERTPTKGFGDTGSSCIRLHAPAGGRNAMGTGFSWGDDGAAPAPSPGRGRDAYAEHMRNNSHAQPPQTAASQRFGVGSQVIYKQIGKAGIEVRARTCLALRAPPAPLPPPLRRSPAREGSARRRAGDTAW